MQTFCLLEELLCIGGTVYRSSSSFLQTGDKAFEIQPCETWIVRLELFWDIIESVLSIRCINCVDYNQTPLAYI